MPVIAGWPTTTDLTLDELLVERGCAVLRRFGERQDSRSVVFGVESATGERYVVKHAEEAQAIAWLESARRFHADVQHPAVPTVVHHVRTATGLGLVEEWGTGEIFSDGYDESVLPRDHHGSAYQRFVRLDAGEIADAIGVLIDVHVAVAAARYVAVDLYDGCVLYDFSARALRLVDLDLYRPGPYVLDGDRAYGSLSYQPPEELRRGATIDERSTVYTLGRMALVYLGCERESAAWREDFRGTDDQFATAIKATAVDPDDRIQTVRELRAAWSS
jgi:hypothetical protein